MSHDHPPIALLRNVSVRRIIRALEYEGFQFTERQGSRRVYRHLDPRRSISLDHDPLTSWLETGMEGTRPRLKPHHASHAT